jgi:hypothetical protein
MKRISVTDVDNNGALKFECEGCATLYEALGLVEMLRLYLRNEQMENIHAARTEELLVATQVKRKGKP